MRVKNTIVINGKVYDAVTGLPAGAPDPIAAPATAHHKSPSTTHHTATQQAQTQPAADITPRHSAHRAKSVHKHTQRSQTLRRDLTARPAAPQHVQVRRKPTPGTVNQSPMISRFAAHPQPLHQAQTHPAASQAPAAAHPVAHTTPTAHPQHHAAKKALSSRELKEKLIAERLASVQETQAGAKHHKTPKRGFFARAPRVSSVVAACFAVVFLGGYLTYINMPNLSMRVAASRAGVAATFPDYRPDGYHFDGPISYNSGEVSVKFASNTNSSSYTVDQKNSNWDSQAVLDNYVTKQSKDYLTYSEQGLTIYAFDGKAAWVNGGVLYTIEGNAPLSTDQLLRIVGSL